MNVRVQQLRADLLAAERLDEVRLESARAPDGERDWAAWADRAYEKAFHEHARIDAFAGSVEDVAERIKASALKGHLADSLDEWAVLTRSCGAASAVAGHRPVGCS